MSSGDIDNRMGDGEILNELIEKTPELKSYLLLAWRLKPVRTFFIPYGAGISQDGERVYISYDIQTIVQGVECESALVRHETVEWGLRQYAGIGEDYLNDPRGHRLANRAEADRAVQLLVRPDGWDIYSEVIDPQVVLDERASLDDRPIPADLALYPYDESLTRKLQEAMLNDRSCEEWDLLTNAGTSGDSNEPSSK